MFLVFLFTFIVINDALGYEKPWYLNMGVGTSQNHYPDNTQNRIDKAIDQPYADFMQAIDFDFGVYWPVHYKFITLQGLEMKLTYDSPVYQVKNPEIELLVKKVVLNYSAYHFVSNNVGKGVFLRGDIGVGRRHVSYEDKGISQSTSYNEYGVNALLGVGYGVRLSYHKEGLIGLSYSTIANQSKRDSSYLFMLSVLW